MLLLLLLLLPLLLLLSLLWRALCLTAFYVCRRNSQIPLPLQLLFGGCSTKRSFYKCLIWWWMTFFFSSILQVPKNAEASASIGCITINPLPPCPFHPLIHPPPPSKDLWSFPLWAGILLRKSSSFPAPRGI